jgi:hypothetical protein
LASEFIKYSYLYYNSDQERTADWFWHSITYADPNMDNAPGDLVDFHGSAFEKLRNHRARIPFLGRSWRYLENR